MHLPNLVSLTAFNYRKSLRTTLFIGWSLLILIMNAPIAHGQNPDKPAADKPAADSVNVSRSVTLYFSEDGKLTTAAKAKEYITIAPLLKDTILYQLEAFTANGKQQSIGQYKALRFPVRWESLRSLTFTDAMRHGPYQEFEANGKPSFQGSYIHGLEQGIHRRFYPNGRVLSETEFVGGVVTGTMRAFYQNGNLKLEYQYRYGFPDGYWIEYDEKGKKRLQRKISQGTAQPNPVGFDEQQNPLPAKPNQ